MSIEYRERRRLIYRDVADRLANALAGLAKAHGPRRSAYEALRESFDTLNVRQIALARATYRSKRYPSECHLAKLREAHEAGARHIDDHDKSTTGRTRQLVMVENRLVREATEATAETFAAWTMYVRDQLSDPNLDPSACRNVAVELAKRARALGVHEDRRVVEAVGELRRRGDESEFDRMRALVADAADALPRIADDLKTEARVDEEAAQALARAVDLLKPGAERAAFANELADATNVPVQRPLPWSRATFNPGFGRAAKAKGGER